MSLIKIKTLFENLTSYDAWSIQLLKIKNSKRNGTNYIGRDITLKPDGRLNEFIAEISARYTNTKNGVLFSYADVTDYDGSAISTTIYKLAVSNPLISKEYTTLITAIANPDNELDPLEFSPQAYLLKGIVKIDDEEYPIKLVSMQRPVTNLKHKFFNDNGTFKELSDKVLSLKPVVDVIILGNCIYLLAFSGENLFNMERSRALVENSELTVSEQKLHKSLKKIVGQIAELAHCGEKSFVFEELLDKSDLDLKSLLRDSVTEMLQEREDIQMAESRTIDVDFQPDITVEAKPTQELTFYCPLRIVREYDESDYEFDEEVLDEQEEIPSMYAVDCAREINDFIQDYSEPEEEHRGLMVYFDRNPAVSEKVFSAIPSVKEINGELMGVFECQITEDLTGSELEDLRSHLTGQCSDGFFEGMEQHPIKTADLGEIYVSFWNDSNDWSLQTSEEMGIEQTEDLSEEPQVGIC